MSPDGLLVNVIAAPPDGAGALNVMVPVTALPPVILPGLNVRFDGTADVLAGFTVIIAPCVVPPTLARSATPVAFDTLRPVTGKLAELLPAGMVTEDCICNTPDGVALNVTLAPPDGAEPVR